MTVFAAYRAMRKVGLSRRKAFRYARTMRRGITEIALVEVDNEGKEVSRERY